MDQQEAVATSTYSPIFASIYRLLPGRQIKIRLCEVVAAAPIWSDTRPVLGEMLARLTAAVVNDL